MIYKICSLLILFSVIALSPDLMSQELPDPEQLEELGTGRIEAILEDLPDPAELSIDINKCSKEDLNSSGLFSEEEIAAVLRFRRKKPIRTIGDLEKAGIEPTRLNHLRPYIIFAETRDWNLSSRSMVKFKPARWNGELSVREKLIFRTGRFSFGFSSDKDGPEQSLLDFYSWYVTYDSPAGILKKAIIGRFKADIAQGVTLSSSGGISKSISTPVSVLKGKTAFKPYTGTYEIGYLQGCSLEICYRGLELTPFLSITGRPVNLSNGAISSFDEDTVHESTDRVYKTGERLFGLRTGYTFKEHKLGFTWIRSGYEDPFEDNNYPMIHDAFSLDWDILLHPLILRGEVSIKDDEKGGAGGLIYKDDLFRQVLLLRYYSRDFINTHCQPFSTQSRPENEFGIYWGNRIILGRLRLNTYVDLWRFPAPRYFEKMPTAGSEFALKVAGRIYDLELALTLKYKSHEKYRKIQESRIRDLCKTSVKFDCCQNMDKLRFKTRFGYTDEYLPREEIYSRGYYIMENIRLKWKNYQLVVQILAYKSDPLIYLYEAGISGNIDNLILCGDGIRYTLAFALDLFKGLKWEFKFGGEYDDLVQGSVCSQITCRL